MSSHISGGFATNKNNKKMVGGWRYATLIGAGKSIYYEVYYRRYVIVYFKH